MKNSLQISPGENLKRIRTDLGLTQNQITGKEVTRNLISMIENNKTPLYYRTAKLISDNINKISDEKNLRVFISPEDIMNPDRVEAKSKVDRYIRELTFFKDNQQYDLRKEYLNEIEDLLKKWNIPEKKVTVYELLGDISYLNEDLHGEYTYMTRALENYFSNPVRKDIYVIVIKLIANCVTMGKNKEAIRLSNLTTIKEVEMPDKYRASLRYNKATAYENMKEYDQSLELLNQLQSYSENIEEKLLRKALILEGICYSKKGDKETAIKKYKRVIEISKDTNEEMGLAYSNIMSLYKSIDIKEQVLKYRKEFMLILPEVEKECRYLIDIYYSLAQVSEYLGENELAEKFFIKSYNISISNKKYDKRAKSVIALLNLYKNNEEENRDKIEKIFKEFLSSFPISENVKALLEIILQNLESGRDKEVSDVIKKVLCLDDRG